MSLPGVPQSVEATPHLNRSRQKSNIGFQIRHFSKSEPWEIANHVKPYAGVDRSSLMEPGESLFLFLIQKLRDKLRELNHIVNSSHFETNIIESRLVGCRDRRTLIGRRPSSRVERPLATGVSTSK